MVTLLTTFFVIGLGFISECVFAISGGGRIGMNNPGYHSTVALKLHNDVFCSGVLIDDRTVITTASCLQKLGNVQSIAVGFGKSAVNGVTAQLSVARTQWRTHEDFNPDAESGTTKNDIALIVLSQPAGMGFFASPIGTNDFIAPQMTIRINGFGESTDDPQGSEKLIRETHVVVDRVKDSLAEFTTQAPYDNPRASINDGDLGGPAYGINADGSLSSLGVASRILQSGNNGGFRVSYTDLRKFGDWIAKTRQLVLENLDTETSRWHDQYFATMDDVYLHLAWQVVTNDLDTYLTNSWITVTGKKIKENTEVSVRLTSVFFEKCEQTKTPEWTGKEFRAHLTELEGCQLSSQVRNSESKLEIWVNGIKQINPINHLDFFFVNLSQ